jgi:hypothetical protein
MFSLQAMFGKGDRFYGLLEQSAEAACDSARAMRELVSQADHAPVMAAFASSRAREKALAAQISEELVNTSSPRWTAKTSRRSTRRCTRFPRRWRSSPSATR